VSKSRDGCIYRVEIRQHLAKLDGPSNCATYQNKTSADIIEEVIKRNDLRPWVRVVQRLRRQHPRHPFRMQYNMGDWAYCRLEMEQAGLFMFTEEDRHGEVQVIADDIDGYSRPAISVKDRPPSGMHTFEESIYSLKVKTRAIPESFIVADFSPDNHAMIIRKEGQARDEFSTEGHDNTTMGTPMVWGTHHGDEAGAKREATLRHEAARAQQVTCKAKSTIPSIRPGCIVKPDTLADNQDGTLDAKEGVFVTKVVHRGAPNANYRNTFRAIPSNRPYRLPVDESKWPRVHTLGFTVKSPNDYTYPYLDAEGRIIVRFHCDFGNWPKGVESIPLRMAKPFASKNRSGLNMPPVDGDFGIAGFYEGNPNKPFALAFIPTARNPDLINSSRRRMSRSEIRTRSGNKLWFEDWDNQQGIELSTEHSGRSQLNLGFIPDRDLNERGTGAELRTSGHLVGRGGAGVMVTAHNQAGGSGKVLAMDETDAQLKDHRMMSKSLADSAEASKASPADTNAQQAIHDGLHELKKPGVLVTGPGPAGIVSGDGVQFAADGSIIGTAKKGIHFSTLKRFTAMARGVVSFFSQKGMSLITAAGDLVMQAQRGRAQLASQGDMTFETVDGVLHVKSSKEIVLACGGTYMKLSPGGIEFGSRGGALFRTTALKKIGPAQMDLGGAAFAPKFVPYTTSCEVWRKNPDFVPAPAPAPEMNAAETMVAPAPAPAPDAGVVAPSPFSDFFSGLSSGGVPQGASAYSPFDGKPTNVDSWGPKGKIAIKTPGDQQQTPVAPDPIKLANAVPCDWKITDMKSDIKGHVEAISYWGMEDNRTKWVDKKTGTQYRGGGSRDSYFEFAYSEQDKTITCTVRVMLIPMDLVPVDAAGKPDLTADEQSLPYTFEVHSRMAPGDIVDGVKMVYRDAVGEKYDVGALRNRIEGVLNKGGYKLILDGCSKGAACGCRVKVNFKADLRVSIKGTSLKNFNEHVSLHLYPAVLRADTGSWGEQYKYLDNNMLRDCDVAHVEAHECGHYFNFPDEYYARGGWLHESYIKNEQIDFPLVDAKAGCLLWQGRSPTNLMGYGALLAVKNGRATIKPYYLEYVRRQFSLATNKLWRVGYES
ncbi:type VI secretion system Vgr family protein, partial [Paraburkholderia tagetis]